MLKVKIRWKDVYYLGRRIGDYVLISEPELLFVIKNNPERAKEIGIGEETLIKEGVKKYKNFWEIFFTVRDLILRGYRCRFEGRFIEIYEKGIIPGTVEPAYLAYPVSEGTVMKWKELLELLNETRKRGIKLLLAIVDWEGDVTYYEIRNARV